MKSKTLKSAIRCNQETRNTNDVVMNHWTLWKVEYNEFDGSYYVSDPEYQLQRYVEKLLQERTILPKEIEKLLDLQHDVDEHNHAMDECD